MHKISGVLNVFYPFELKDNTAMCQIRKAYDKKRDAQIKTTRYQHHPRTDMMDREDLRWEMEDAQVSFHTLLSPFGRILFTQIKKIDYGHADLQ